MKAGEIGPIEREIVVPKPEPQRVPERVPEEWPEPVEKPERKVPA